MISGDLIISLGDRPTVGRFQSSLGIMGIYDGVEAETRKSQARFQII